MRELTTIGSLRAARTIERASRLAPLRGMGYARYMGATNTSFAPPAGLSATTMGSDLSTALNTLLQNFTANGVPPESSSDPSTLAFQQAWNADPTVTAVGGNALLDTDGGYGPNVALAVATVNGGSTWPVNTGAANVSATTTTMATGSNTPVWIAVGIVAALGAAFLAHRMMKKRRRPARRYSRAIVLA